MFSVTARITSLAAARSWVTHYLLGGPGPGRHGFPSSIPVRERPLEGCGGASLYSCCMAGPILVLDSGSPLVSVAVGRAGVVLAVRSAEIARSSALLLAMVDAALR